MANLVEQFKGNPVKTGLKVIGYIVVLGVVLYVAHCALPLI